MGTPDCKYTENILVDLIRLNLQAKSPLQTIWYQFKWDMALRKRTKLPSARAANLEASSDNTAYVVESISVMRNHAYPYYDTSLRICTMILLKSKLTGKKDPRTNIFKLVK